MRFDLVILIIYNSVILIGRHPYCNQYTAWRRPENSRLFEFCIRFF